MDRADPSHPVPASASGASSSAPNAPGTQAPASESAGIQGSSSAPGPSSEPLATARPQTTDVQREGELEGVHAQTIQHESGSQQGSNTGRPPTPEVPVVQHSNATALQPPEIEARPLTGSTLGGPSGSPDRLSASDPTQAPGQRGLEPTSVTGVRPTTGSTLGGPGIAAESRDHGPENPPTPPPRPQLPQIRTGRSGTRGVGIVTPPAERLEDAETISGLGHHELGRDSGMRLNQTLPIFPSARTGDSEYAPRRQRTLDGQGSNLGHGMGRRSATANLDWAVPVNVEELKRKRTVEERMRPTINEAMKQCNKFRTKARMTGLALNAAIGVQVLLGSITTGLSAVATTGGRATAIPTTIFGALSTLVASYLARARGSGEPELSTSRVKDLEHFLREVNAFVLDCGHVDTDEHNDQIRYFRDQLEQLLGNASGERKLSGPI